MCREKKRVESELVVTKVIIWQDKPYTAASVFAELPDGECHHAYGFSKVQYPDEWDADFGESLAIEKAVAKIAKQIVKERAKSTGMIIMGGVVNDESLLVAV